ncbi:MAG: hypothetical protein KBD15_00160 [Candidatus Magasanikbacteria bacterium]|nr:hypothetical protein [Candidatus Magasanikbacteria bacterium]
MSLDRLIDLAKRTGDRLIIHDPYTNRDMVIMDVDQYTRLLEGRTSVHDLTSQQMVDKINRDVSIWRSNHEEDEQEELAAGLYEEVLDMPLFQENFEQDDEDSSEDDWESIGDVVEEHYGDFFQKETSSVSEKVTHTPFSYEDLPQEQEGDVASTDLVYEIPVTEELNFVQPVSVETYPQNPPPQHIPRVHMPETAFGGVQKPLKEKERSPIFFEEPLS